MSAGERVRSIAGTLIHQPTVVSITQAAPSRMASAKALPTSPVAASTAPSTMHVDGMAGMQAMSGEVLVPLKPVG